MEKKRKKTIKPSEIILPEKHPLEEPPAEPEESTISEEDLDEIPDEEPDETHTYEPPPPGEGP